MPTALMQEIQRQKDPVLREAVSLAAKGEAAASLRHIREVREIRDDHERRAAIAGDYARMTPQEGLDDQPVNAFEDHRRRRHERGPA